MCISSFMFSNFSNFFTPLIENAQLSDTYSIYRILPGILENSTNSTVIEILRFTLTFTVKVAIRILASSSDLSMN